MNPYLAAAVLSLTLAGCAGMDAAACRSANWYDLGFRDAIFALQPQDDIYVAQCGGQNVAVDQPRYREGWLHGDYERQNRQTESVD